MSPQSRTRKPKQRKSRAGSLTKPTVGKLAREAIDMLADVEGDITPLDAEAGASVWLGSVWRRGQDDDTFTEAAFVDAIVGIARRESSANAYTALEALWLIADDSWADAVRTELARDPARSRPEWAAALTGARTPEQPTGVRVWRDAWDAQRIYDLAYADPEPHHLLAVETRTGVPYLHAVTVADALTDDDLSDAQTPLSLPTATALDDLGRAFAATMEVGWPDDDESVCLDAPLLRWRLADHIELPEATEMADAERATLVDLFVAEAFPTVATPTAATTATPTTPTTAPPTTATTAPPTTNPTTAVPGAPTTAPPTTATTATPTTALDKDELRDCAEFFLDFGEETLVSHPLAWNPAAVEVFMVDWMPDLRVWTDAPLDVRAAALEAWIRFALTRRGLAEADIDPVVAEVAAHLADVDESGPVPELPDFDEISAQLFAYCEEHGVDADDPEAVAAIVPDYLESIGLAD